MNPVERESLLWCLVFGGLFIAVALRGLLAGLEEQRRADYFSGLGDIPSTPQQTTPAETSDARPADLLES